MHLLLFLNFVAGRDTGEDESSLVKRLREEVEKARKHEEWRQEHMTLLMRDKEKIDEGREEGRQEGLKKGREEERRENVLRMLRKGKSSSEIADFCGYDLDYVKTVESGSHS
jgi:predicted transposase/invertase (TIGR01784 family)